jgi:hypothetical protein
MPTTVVVYDASCCCAMPCTCCPTGTCKVVSSTVPSLASADPTIQSCLTIIGAATIAMTQIGSCEWSGETTHCPYKNQDMEDTHVWAVGDFKIISCNEDSVVVDHVISIRTDDGGIGEIEWLKTIPIAGFDCKKLNIAFAAGDVIAGPGGVIVGKTATVTSSC